VPIVPLDALLQEPAVTPASLSFRPVLHRCCGLPRLCRDVSVWLSALCALAHAGAIHAQEAPPPQPSESAVVNSESGSLTDSLLQDRPIGQLQASIAAPTPKAPDNLARKSLAEIGMRPQPLGLGRGWCLEPFLWEASATRHLPTYFEEPNLERLGYYYGLPLDGSLAHASRDSFEYWYGCRLGLVADEPPHPLIQPFVSAAHFYGRVVGLPYLLAASQWPYEEVYSLGEDLPGSPVPYRKHYLPLSLRSLQVQGELLK